MPHAHLQFHAQETARHKRDTSDRSAKVPLSRLSLCSEGALSLSLSRSERAAHAHAKWLWGRPHTHAPTLLPHCAVSQLLDRACSGGTHPFHCLLPPCRRATIPVAP